MAGCLRESHLMLIIVSMSLQTTPNRKPSQVSLYGTVSKHLIIAVSASLSASYQLLHRLHIEAEYTGANQTLLSVTNVSLTITR